jgi:hypothetical protein
VLSVFPATLFLVFHFPDIFLLKNMCLGNILKRLIHLNKAMGQMTYHVHLTATATVLILSNHFPLNCIQLHFPVLLLHKSFKTNFSL